MRRHNPTNTSRLAENAHARTGTVNIYYLCSVRMCELLDASKWPRISGNNKKPQFFKLIKTAPFSIPSFRALSRWWWLCRRCCSCSGLRTLRFCWAVLPPHPRVTLIFLPPPHSLLSVFFSLALSLALSHVVFCLWGLCGENFQTSGSFKTTKPPVWWLGGKTVWPLETWVRSISGGRQNAC